MMKTAEITTERLRLVPVTERHINDIFENFTSDVTVYMYPSPAERLEETAEAVERFISQREAETDFVYAITLKENGEFLGLVGLHNLKNEVPELGIWTKTESHGNHYGREAIGGVILLAKKLGCRRLCYPVDRRNTASRKIPVYYGGKLKGLKDVKTPDGRLLEIETYIFELSN